MSFSDVSSARAGANPPLLLDVRRRAAFVSATEMAAGALRRDPDAVAQWGKSLPCAATVVVYCVHGHEVSQRVAAALRERGLQASYLEGGLEEGWKAHGGALDAKARDANTRWITRERPKIDRVACPWLIARFIDPDAEFLYVPPGQVRDAAAGSGAIPYDIPGVSFSHAGALCSFDAFLGHYRLADPALQHLATIVRAADTAALDQAREAPGLLAISLGLSRVFADDHEMLKHGMVMYDALYAWCAQEEAQSWNLASRA
jgi:rhodanese-related sulfurtransferase